MTHTDKDYSIIVTLFIVDLTGEQNLLALIRSKILTSASIATWKLKLTQVDNAIQILL